MPSGFGEYLEGIVGGTGVIPVCTRYTVIEYWPEVKSIIVGGCTEPWFCVAGRKTGIWTGFCPVMGSGLHSGTLQHSSLGSVTRRHDGASSGYVGHLGK